MTAHELLVDAGFKCAALMNHLRANVNPEAKQSPEWPINIICQSQEDAQAVGKLMTDAQNALRNAGFEIK